MERIAYPLREAAETLGIGLRTLQEYIAKGDIIARYAGRKPLIPAEELRKFLDRLPTEPPK